VKESQTGPRVDPTVAVGLGSNRGNRLANLRFGVTRLRGYLEGLSISSVYETRPMYYRDQPWFLNACVTGRTRLSARQLLSELQDCERAAGRRPARQRWGPRTLDLDVLLYGDHVVREPRLVIPHPRLHERAFVLVPLAEIAPEWVVPGPTGDAETVATLAARIDGSGVEKLEEAL